MKWQYLLDEIAIWREKWRHRRAHRRLFAALLRSLNDPLAWRFTHRESDRVQSVHGFDLDVTGDGRYVIRGANVRFSADESAMIGRKVKIITSHLLSHDDYSNLLSGYFGAHVKVNVVNNDMRRWLDENCDLADYLAHEYDIWFVRDADAVQFRMKFVEYVVR